jgi:DNA-binding NarL/FixJ family response regulator
MPEINGITLARRLAEDCPGVRVIILTLYEERSFLKQALAAGVKGYVLKRSAAENLVSVIRAVQFGETYVDPLLGDEVRKGSTPLADSVPQTAAGLGLTDREASVLKYSPAG